MSSLLDHLLPRNAPPGTPHLMEYILVEIKDKPKADTEVLINRKPNGRTGVLVMLGGPGRVLVSADWPGAVEQKVNVKNTTPRKPMKVTIECT